MKPTKTAKEFVKELLSTGSAQYMLRNAESGMENELEHAELFGVEESDYYNPETGNLDMYQFDIASGSWGWRQFIPLLEWFEFDGVMIEDEHGYEFILDENGEHIEVGWIWEEIYQYAAEVANEMTKQSHVEGYFYFSPLESDGSYGLFYSHPMIEAEENLA